MSEYLLESDVSYYKYTCHSCGNNFYHVYKCLDNCPHCGVECGEKTRSSQEMISETIFYEIDPKTGEVTAFSPSDVTEIDSQNWTEK